MTRNAGNTRKLNDDQIKEAKRLRAKGWRYWQLARLFNVGQSTVRRYCDERQHMKALERDKERVARQRLGVHNTYKVTRSEKHDAFILMDEIPDDTRDLTARLMGDPLPGRRAIDMRRS